MRIGLLASIMLALATPGAARAQVPASTTTAPIDSLVDVLVPVDHTVAQTIDAARGGFRAQAQADVNLQALDKRKPGLFAAAEKGLTEVMTDQAPDLAGGLRTRLRDLLSSRLTPDELVTVSDFYRSPTGQRMLARARESASVQGLAKGTDVARQAVDAGNLPTFSAKDVQSLTNAITADAIRSIEAEDVPALQRFGASSASPKLASLSGELNNVVVEEVNRWITRTTPLIQTKMIDVIRRHMQGKP